MGTTYRHVTLRQYLPSILAEGLDPACATGKQPLVWLHTPHRTEWAVTHTMQRHRVDPVRGGGAGRAGAPQLAAAGVARAVDVPARDPAGAAGSSSMTHCLES